MSPLASSANAFTATPLIGFGQVRHTRLRPRRHAFAYATFFLMLPLRSLRSGSDVLPLNRGYTFNPASFWYCHAADNSLRAIVVEVNNTFGERHCYLLDRPHYGEELHARKVFHVSPFCDVSGGYRFRFMRTQQGGEDRSVVRIDHDDATGLLLQTSVSGSLLPVSRVTLRRALWGYPLMTFAVMARIHWHALRLWLKRVGFRRKPDAPSNPVSR